MVKKLHVRRGDTVMVMSGKDQKKVGKVLTALPKSNKVVVENVNVVARHTKPKGQGQEGGILRAEGAIYASRVMLYCTACKKPTRISHKLLDDGSKVRVCKHCQKDLG